MNYCPSNSSFEAVRAKDRPDVQVFTEIGIIDQLTTARLERSLPDGMSVAQFKVLTHFCRRGGAETPAQLARAFQVTKGAMTNTLQRLEAQGFVDIVHLPVAIGEDRAIGADGIAQRADQRIGAAYDRPHRTQAGMNQHGIAGNKPQGGQLPGQVWPGRWHD